MEITMTVAVEVDPSTISSYALVRTGIADWILRAAAALRDLGPYAAIELLLPGGSLVILLLWLYRRHKKSTAAVALPESKIGSLHGNPVPSHLPRVHKIRSDIGAGGFHPWLPIRCGSWGSDSAHHDWSFA